MDIGKSYPDTEAGVRQLLEEQSVLDSPMRFTPDPKVPGVWLVAVVDRRGVEIWVLVHCFQGEFEEVGEVSEMGGLPRQN